MVEVRPIGSADKPWVARRLGDVFGGVDVARKGVLIDPSVLPGYVATYVGRPVGLLTHDVADGECEVVAVLSTERGLGVGRVLMDAARDRAVAAGCHRLWLVTTNDNARAFRFYQRWGMDLCAFYRHGARLSREAKPSLPRLGADGIPLEHELEFELKLEMRRSPSGSRATRPIFR